MIKVLVADDDKFARDFLWKVLSEEGYEVQLVESGSEAVRKILKQNFDLLFLDIYMGGMDGLDTISLVKQINPKIPIIAITGDTSLNMKNKIQDKKVFAYLTKPLNPVKVKKIVKLVLTIPTSLEGI